MKLAGFIEDLNAATVAEIKCTLKNTPTKSNVINITDEISIGVGEYVLYGEDKAIDSLNLGQILSIEDARDVSKMDLRESNIPPNKYKNPRTRVALVREHETLPTISKLDRTKEENKLVPHRLKEAIPTAVCRYVLAENIKQIAFVFLLKDTQDGNFTPQAMWNAFAVKKRRDPSGRISPASHKGFITFYNECSFSKRMWDIVVAIQQGQHKKLSCGGMWNGRTKHDHFVGINKEFSLYCKHCHTLRGDDILELKHDGTKPMKVQNPDLSIQNKRVKQVTKTIRAIDEPEIKKARNTLGMVEVANTDTVPSFKAIKEKKPKQPNPYTIAPKLGSPPQNPK